MPFAYGALGIHDDLNHTGSAKRNTANGTAALNTFGNIIAPGKAVLLTRDANNDIMLYEATSVEQAITARRTGANAFTLYNNTVAGGKVIQDSSMKDVASGIVGLDANTRMQYLELPAKLRLGMLGNLAWTDMTIVQGNWASAGAGSQTDWDDSLVAAAGYIENDVFPTNLDEFKLAGLLINAGTYVITVITANQSNSGILEVLFGASSIGTADTYSAGGTFNNVNTFTLTQATRATQDLRFRVNGKNAGSSGYDLHISRIQIQKTA